MTVIFILIAALAIVSSLTATVFIMSQVSFADAAQARAWQGKRIPELTTV